MKGGPFRIAAAGLCTAFLWSVVAGITHFRSEGPRLAAATAPPPAIRSDLPADDSGAPDHASGAVVLADSGASHVESVPLVRTPDIRPQPPRLRRDERTASLDPDPSIRLDAPVREFTPTRSPEFCELPPPPDLDVLVIDVPPVPPSAVAAMPFNSELPAPLVLAELSSMRRDLDRFLERQHLERLQDQEQRRRELVERQLELALADLRTSVEALRDEQQKAVAAPGLQGDPEIAAPVGSNAVPPPVDFGTPEPEPSPGKPNRDPVPEEQPAKAASADEPPLKISITARRERGRFDFEIDGAELQAVLAAIGQLGGSNIIASPEVSGTVTAVWQNTTPPEVLDALAAAHRLVVERQARFVVVSTAAQSEARQQAPRTTLVRLYRPIYVAAHELTPLLEPLLTPGIGHLGVTLPSGNSGGSTGGDSRAQPDAILVVDYPEVIEIVGRTILELDVPAPQIELEATILDVQFTESARGGVSRLLRPAALRFDDDGAMCETDDISCQCLPDDCGGIVEELRRTATVRVVSSARLCVLNRQPAELCVGDALVWRRRTGAGGASDFNVVEGGARLRVRPFVSADHLVRLEVSPEVATGAPGRLRSAWQAFASVSTNVTVPNCGTLVIAGLNIEEDIPDSRGRFNPLGKLAARLRRDRVTHRELVVMISPRIVSEAAPQEVDLQPAAAEAYLAPPLRLPLIDR
ncbi:MAG: hypothetical protein KF774_19295 [Planctomyces sp.]|nr:hypothetical protein [Planctomyces sp.]